MNVNVYAKCKPKAGETPLSLRVEVTGQSKQNTFDQVQSRQSLPYPG